MSEFLKHTNYKFYITVFFLISLLEIIGETLIYKPLIYFCKPLIPISLILVYSTTSKVKNKIFITICILSSITNLLFIPNSPRMLFYGVLSFTILRILMIVYIFQLVKIENIVLFALSTLLYLILFTYLFYESETPKDSFFLLIFHNIMIAIFGGIALSNYLKNENQQNSYLMICSLLFTGLQLILFIEKYSLQSFTVAIFRPLAMILNCLAFFSFYKFVLISEDIKQQ